MASPKVILLYSQKRLPKIENQTILAEPAPGPLGQKFDQKITYVLLIPREKKMPRASALAPQARYGGVNWKQLNKVYLYYTL